MKFLTQLEEKVPQGTSPLLIDSSTLVTNLNADLLDGNHASAFSLSTHNHTGVYQPIDADLTSIAGLTGTSGLLRKTAANTWSLDTTVYGDMTKAVYDTNNSGAVDKAEGVINQNGGTLINGTWVGTLVQYNAIGSKDANTTYIITDEPKIYQGAILLGQSTTTTIVRW